MLGKKICWIPWQFRLPNNTRSTWRPRQPIRAEAQIIASAFLNLTKTPEVPVEHMRLAVAWLERIQTVFRNAWALCGAAHLQNLKGLDKKVRELCLQQLGLRTPTTAELIAADRKIWAAIGPLTTPCTNLRRFAMTCPAYCNCAQEAPSRPRSPPFAQQPVKPQRSQKTKRPTKRPLKRTRPQNLSAPTMKNVFFCIEIDDFGHPSNLPQKGHQGFSSILMHFGAL